MSRRAQIPGCEVQLREEINLLSQCECTMCSHAASLGTKALTISCSDTFQKKLLPEDVDDVLEYMGEVLSECNQANAMQDVDTPGSLDSHHPTTLSMAPPEPPSCSQTAESGTPSSLPEAGDPSQKSVPMQLSPKFQPLSQSYSKKVDSGRTPRIILPKVVAQLGPQNCSTSMELGDFISSSPGFQNPSKAMRAMTAIFNKIKKQSFITRKPPKFTSSDYTKEDVQRALAITSSKEVAFDIVADIAKKMAKGRESISAQDELLFFCLCKVLQSIGVDDRRLQDLRLNSSYDSSFKWYFVGVKWANQLLEEMFDKGWDHDAVDLLLSWGLRVIEYTRFDQWTRVFMNTPGSGRTKTSKPDFRKNLVEFCEDPSERVKMGSTSIRDWTPDSESLPSRVWNILLGSVSGPAICSALGSDPEHIQRTLMPTKAKIRVFKKPDWRPSKTHVAQPVTTPTMHKSQSVAKLDWRTPQDNGFVSPYSDGPEMSKDSRNIDSSHYSQSSSNGRNVTYKNDYDTLVDSTSIWPKAQTVQNMDWSTPQNNGHVSSYNSGSGISKDSWNIDSSHYFPSSSNGRNVRYKNEYDVLADSAKWSTSHDNDYISSYSSGFDIPELTRRIDSSRQAQTSSNARVAAPTNDHDMLVNSALWPKLHISETAQWTITRREIEIAAQSWKVVDSLQAQTFSHTRGRPRKRDYDILGDSPLTWLPPQTIDNSQQTTSSKRRKFSWDGRKVANSRQAQRSSNVGEAAHVNDQDMLGDSLQSMPKDFVLNSQGTYREWLAPFSYP